MKQIILRSSLGILLIVILMIAAQKSYWYFFAGEADILNHLAEEKIGNVWLKGSKTIDIEDPEDKNLIRRGLLLRKQVQEALTTQPELKETAWRRALEHKPLQIHASVKNQEITWIESNSEACSYTTETVTVHLQDPQQIACFQEIDLPRLFPDSQEVTLHIAAITDDVEQETKDYLTKKSLEQMLALELVENFRKDILRIRFL